MAAAIDVGFVDELIGCCDHFVDGTWCFRGSLGFAVGADIGSFSVDEFVGEVGVFWFDLGRAGGEEVADERC